ncbi:MAG: hypothetical protein AB2L26_09260 [Ignavibacteria bacterium]
MKNTASVVFNPEPENARVWNLSKNLIRSLEFTWRRIGFSNLEIPEPDEFGYRGLKVNCENGNEYIIMHRHVIKKEEFITSIRDDSAGVMENLLLKSMPENILDYVKPFLFANIAYRKAK